MEIYMERLLCIGIGYCLGCLSPSYFLGKKVKGIDIRDYGSGNAGTTNTIRVLGEGMGAVTLLIDILKAVAAMAVCGLIFGFDAQTLMLWGGFGVIIGHNYPFYMQFRGGKGVASTIGVIVMLDWRLFLCGAVPGLLILFITRYVSLGSMIFTLVSFIAGIVFYWGKPGGWEIILMLAVITALLFWRHRSNIRRLWQGTERKFGQKEKAEINTTKKEEKK